METSPSNAPLPARAVAPSDGRHMPDPPTPLGRILLDEGAVSPDDLRRVAAGLEGCDTLLGDALLAEGLIGPDTLHRAWARLAGLRWVNPALDPPDADLLDMLPADLCLRFCTVPWQRAGRATILLTAYPERADQIRAALPQGLGPIVFAYAPANDIQALLAGAHRATLLRRAETRCPPDESCRTRTAGLARGFRFAAALGVAGLMLVQPALIGWAILAIAACALLANSTLKVLAVTATLRARRSARSAVQPVADIAVPPAPLPRVTVLVPLHREAAVLAQLIDRLGRLDYPRARLDICLVVEEDDGLTRRALERHALPCWMRVIVAPASTLKTKPRALNYALDFCRGTIIGVLDAEDAPEPGQIHAVVRHLSNAGPDVACVQGVLDFYNRRTNWLSRCFSIEYAAWFRVILPGFQHLRLPIPLGGTTFYIRRAALEGLGAWDAHNVTEDADLGMRLARHGYRCEFVPTVTYEEANCRPWAWVRQRSRWLKGFAMTWATHMRRPRQFVRAVGIRGFLTLQVLFLGTLAGFATAPFLWSFWLLPLTGTVPFLGSLPGPVTTGLLVLFITSELVSMAIGVIATSGRDHRFLIPWVPSMHLYYPLGALAVYKAFYELLTRPFFWDKTAHGACAEEPGGRPISRPPS